ncbi:hypothetical protein CRPA12_29720 [Pseudomonas aeruginosa]|nr:hypothetical protein VNPA141581_59210 [Pseudomonas aeruginosa]
MSAMPTTPPMMQNSQSGKAAPKSTSEGDIEQPPSRILASNSACLGRVGIGMHATWGYGIRAIGSADHEKVGGAYAIADWRCWVL